MHSGEHRNVFVDVVVKLDVLLVAVGSEEPADVLDDPALEGDGERQEQGVEFRPIKALTEVGTGSDHDQSAARSRSSHSLMDCSDGLLAEPTLENVDIASGRLQTLSDVVDVTCALGEHETGSALVDSAGHVGTDLFDTVAVLDQLPEDLLDRCRVVYGHEACQVHGQATLHQSSVAQLARLGLVPGGAALELDDPFEPGQGPSLQFTLTGRDPDLELNFEPFGHVAFRTDPDTFFAEYFGDIEELLPPTHFPAHVVDRKVKAMGAKLYDEVVPADLRDQLWAVRDRVESILIQSTDPWVPWEMCFLTGPDDSGTIVEHGFVCERYDVSRWIQGVPLRLDLALERVALVVTGDSGLPSAQAEAAAVRRLQDAGVQVDDVPATYDGVYQALAGGSYSGFHFTGHGLYPQGVDPNRSQIQLEGGIPFRAGDVGGVAKNLEQSSPLVVLNACQAGRGGMGLVGAGGWATALLNAGAGAFVGAHWSVLDDSAALFSDVFYQRLVAGDTLAGAVRRARAAIRTPGDPTWLAYVLYAVCGVRAGLPASDHNPE